ncbi:MAG TPA: hypothetical protein PKA64_04945 [Myxococcota bacterium]|nr:hypothetical protein [Myxococcota bacterium]
MSRPTTERLAGLSHTSLARPAFIPPRAPPPLTEPWPFVRIGDVLIALALGLLILASWLWRYPPT